MPATRKTRAKAEVKSEDETELSHIPDAPDMMSDGKQESEEEEKEATDNSAPVMSAFEKRRLENIKANAAILSDISAHAGGLLPATNGKAASKPKPKPSKRTKGPVVPKQPAVATRRSSRVAGVKPEDHDPKRKVGEVEEDPYERAKRMRISEDLSLDDTLVEGRKWTAGVGGLQGLKGLSRGADPGVRTFTKSDVDNTSDKDLKQMREKISNLSLYDGWEPNDIKLTPSRVYSLGFHPTEDKPIIFAGDKEGAIGIFDASQQTPEVSQDDDDDEVEVPDPIITVLKLHTKTVTSFVFPPNDPNVVYTSSYDSTIRKIDIERNFSVQVFSPEDVMDDMSMSAMEMPTDDTNMLYFSTLHGGFGRHDIRTPKHEHEIWTLSDNKIGGFSLHPAHPHLVATASLDRSMKIWDLRKISGKGDLRHPALLGEHDSRLSVSHASWSSAGHVATSSYDDTIKIYDFSDAGSWQPGQDIANMEPATTVRHNNQTGRWVTILKPKWQANPRDGMHKFVIGNMNRFVDVFAADGEQLGQLDGDGITAVPAAAHFHPTMDWVAGGNGSGKLTLWM